jgi:hypothetical protein
MKFKTTCYVFFSGILLLFTLTVTAVVVATGSWELSGSPPLPPTPGPPPTAVPPAADRGGPVASRDAAIQRALYLDALGTVREQPLTEDTIAAHPDRITVEAYATRQEASDAYWGDAFGDAVLASEPVWVVMIAGRVAVEDLPGGLGSRPGEVDGITYVISQVDGTLLSVSTGIPSRRNRGG